MARTFHHGAKAKSRKFGDDWRWLQSTPPLVDSPNDDSASAAGNTAPHSKRTTRLVDYDDAPLFPLPKKPHAY